MEMINFVIWVREDDVVFVVRMRRRERERLIRPIVVEFKCDKWTVLRNNSDLRMFILMFV